MVKVMKDNLHNDYLFAKTEYSVRKRDLKQALDNGLVLTKLHRLNKFNRKAWLKPYIDIKDILI